VHGLRDLGWNDGANVIIERRSGEGREERIPILMRELVASRVDVIVTSLPLEASRATDSIPIVALEDNPVYERLVVNLPRSANCIGEQSAHDATQRPLIYA
jgi:putative tryptophan/tyrosine transport system substrate-binding protein